MHFIQRSKLSKFITLNFYYISPVFLYILFQNRSTGTSHHNRVFINFQTTDVLWRKSKKTSTAYLFYFGLCAKTQFRLQKFVTWLLYSLYLQKINTTRQGCSRIPKKFWINLNSKCCIFSRPLEKIMGEFSNGKLYSTEILVGR